MTTGRPTSGRLDRLLATGVVAVLRAPSAECATATIEALVRGGISGVEVTYSTPDAAAVISRVVQEHGDAVVVGAGTVLRPAQAREAADAGAEFLVSPGIDPVICAAMAGTGALVVSGALTPTEVMLARAHDADVVKVFPASVVGPGYLSALLGPFPGTSFMPTGGVTPDTLSAWFGHGAALVGAGSDLMPGAAMASGDMAEIERRASLFRTALDHVSRAGHHRSRREQQGR
ncbi:bifunctional 4-hydroxy-2-oxoglutarate aldolase/2-dehydro-3-deoxy-phosphogluconate aldolase [Goekera deserti]|uniref:bifunctional 4-hydroxy-2-oxoglutarate aldolase/2-dehydro-3-deoxy-phosphogluconate aldolase n=1 Tax=Goekera deserti TaxID=2497753 RepID=UPI00192EA204|nr:bifunctional 4-hydroxy-2-oxoglutarate aldolase/2-dehydro-3-deoxy-phosphogluconate aldolase [Goekera deserti]